MFNSGKFDVVSTKDKLFQQWKKICSTVEKLMFNSGKFDVASTQINRDIP